MHVSYWDHLGWPPYLIDPRKGTESEMAVGWLLSCVRGSCGFLPTCINGRIGLKIVWCPCPYQWCATIGFCVLISGPQLIVQTVTRGVITPEWQMEQEMNLQDWVSSTYNLCLASGCYSDKKGDKSDGRRCNSERRRCKSNVEEDKSYRGGVQHLKKRKEDVGGDGVSFSLCAVPLDRLSPRILEEQSYDRGGGVGVGVGVELEEELRVRQKQDEDRALLILRYEEIHRDLYTNWKDRILVINTRHVKGRVGETHERKKHMKRVNTWKE